MDHARLLSHSFYYWALFSYKKKITWPIYYSHSFNFFVGLISQSLPTFSFDHFVFHYDDLLFYIRMQLYLLFLGWKNQQLILIPRLLLAYLIFLYAMGTIKATGLWALY